MPYSRGRYDNDGEEFENNNSPPQQKGGSHGGPDGYSDSKSHHGTHDYGREYLRSKEMHKFKLREREKECNRNCDRHHRDHNRKGSDRNHCVQDKDDDYDRHRSRDYVRHRDNDRDVEGWHKWHNYRSRSRVRSHHRSRFQSPSQSRSKSKRVSGFDVAPPTTALIPGTDATGQLTGAIPTVPGMFPNMLEFTGQFGSPLLMHPHAMTPQATRHARRVYVGGLPSTVNEQSVATFFSLAMASIGGNSAAPGDSVVNVYINHEKMFAFVEMRSVEEASNAMALNGIIFEGKPVKVSRPSDYNPILAAALGPSQPNPNLNLAAVGLAPRSSDGLEGPDRIFVGGIPYYITEAQIRELLESYGPLCGFDLVKDRETGNSKGYAFCMYQDLSVTDDACKGLDGLTLGDKILTVRRANQGMSQPKPDQESTFIQAQQQVFAFQGAVVPAKATKFVCLTQAVIADELKDDKEFESILEDMKTEGGKYGELVNVVIPRPGPNSELSTGVGKVFLEYADLGGAIKARTFLNGRKFDGRVVMADFYLENSFVKGEYGG
ncbi:splicing factor U2af large subunit B-like isoform X4 [Telopea speciosissima]|uniref:splicing factor U2af large subunit B-like isoform X4 n=1 Tax=Telopea speciosissima TaxID=54955 RepID=UPI001CC44FF6|nr:splicing factor U2af large subunit B-like isoform X4 [Telopea speciosissima]